MGWCKKDITPLLTHCSYVSLALTHQNAMRGFNLYFCKIQMFPNGDFNKWNLSNLASDASKHYFFSKIFTKTHHISWDMGCHLKVQSLTHVQLSLLTYWTLGDVVVLKVLSPNTCFGSWALVKLFYDECHRTTLMISQISSGNAIVAWCCQAISHYLSQCWSKYMSSYRITKPYWVKLCALCYITWKSTVLDNILEPIFLTTALTVTIFSRPRKLFRVTEVILWMVYCSQVSQDVVHSDVMPWKHFLHNPGPLWGESIGHH